MGPEMNHIPERPGTCREVGGRYQRSKGLRLRFIAGSLSITCDHDQELFLVEGVEEEQMPGCRGLRSNGK